MRRFDKIKNIRNANLLVEHRYLNESVGHLVHKDDYEEFLQTYGIKEIWDEEKELYKLYRSQDIEPIGYFDPKHNKLIYERGSEFDKMATQFNWSRGY